MALEPDTLISPCANPALEPTISSLLLSLGTKTSATYRFSKVLARDPKEINIRRIVEIRCIFAFVSAKFPICPFYIFYIVKHRKISLAYIIHFLVAISFSISIDSADLDSHILEYGALYELKISDLPLRIKILREVNRMQNSEKIAVFKASSAFFSIDERSRFMLDRGEIVPLEYSYKRRALGKTDRDTFAFTQNNNSSELGSVQDRNEENVFDKLSVQYQLQLDLKLFYLVH